MNKEEYQNELEKILNSCMICHAKMCKTCPNGRRKRKLRAEMEEKYPETKERSVIDKIKKLFLKK